MTYIMQSVRCLVNNAKSVHVNCLLAMCACVCGVCVCLNAYDLFCRNRDNEPGIEMKVMHEDGHEVSEDIAASVEKAINEISGENSMVSIDNVNSIIGKIMGERERT